MAVHYVPVGRGGFEGELGSLSCVLLDISEYCLLPLARITLGLCDLHKVSTHACLWEIVASGHTLAISGGR
jgi:hypothetical protein